MPEGHTEGNLNFVATRRGWSRNFTLPPDGVAKMDYSTLESVLELNTLKLRTGRLRIFVENPAGSGTYNLVRRWENDDSLYSVLVHNFFTERMNEGVVTTLDVRDEPEEARNNESGTGGTFKADRAREWLKTRALNTRSAVGTSSTTPSGAQSPADEGHAGEEAATPATQTETPSTATNGSGYFFSLFKGNAAGTPPVPPPKENGSDIAAKPDTASQATAPPSPPPSDTEKEEDILRARGWKPMVRRLTRMRVPRKDGTIESRPEADIMEEGDGEYIEYPDPLEMSADALATPKKQRLFKRIPGSDAPFLSPKKSKKDVKGKAKAPEPVTIVKNPEDAMPAPVDETPVPFPSSDPGPSA
ncbi:hypothetical protein PENSPDRAFT_663148 [Peniophora sp. CONT]|nr:hypothetical protein PENSPDRAFT_663148 [Peniophora sp. CONT]